MTFPQVNNEVLKEDAVVILNTTVGTIKLKLFPTLAPKTVQNFIELSKQGYYNGVIFHRVIQGFMIQGGDPSGTGRGGKSIYGERFEDEFSDQLFHLRGAISMANAGPNTNGSQFFIVQNQQTNSAALSQLVSAGYPQEIMDAYKNNGGTPHLDGRHSVFGQVIEGLEVVDQIAGVPRDSSDRPLTEVKITSIEVH